MGNKVFWRDAMTSLRDAAQAAYRAMIAAELSDGSRKEWEAAVDGLKAALAEPKWIDENDLDAVTASKFKFVLTLTGKSKASLEMSGLVSGTAKDAILKILLDDSRPDVTQSSPLPPV